MSRERIRGRSIVARLVLLLSGVALCPGFGESFTLAAQELRPIETLNMGFEPALVPALGDAGGWYRFGPSHVIAPDSTEAAAGRQSMRIEALRPAPSQFGTAYATLPVRTMGLRTGRVSLRGLLKVRGVDSGYAGLWVRVQDSRGAVLAFDNMDGRGITGTREWTPVEVEVALPTEADKVVFGVLLVGPGTVWADELTLRINGKDVALAGPQRAPTASELARLKRESAPLESLTQFVNWSAAHQVLGLGEGTHGTSEFIELRRRVVEAIAAKSKTIAVVLEANMPETRSLDAYVNGRPGSVSALLASLYFPLLQTTEMADFLEWARDLNRRAPGSVRVWGMDAQVPSVAMDSVEAFVRRHDPAFLPELREWHAVIRSVFNDATRGTPQPDLSSWKTLADSVVSHLSSNVGRYRRSGVDSASIDWALQYSSVVGAAARAAITDVARDSLMAANVMWIRERIPKGTPMIIWAHNAHLQRVRPWLGWRLQQRLGSSYFPVALTTGTGEYAALDSRGIGTQATTPAERGSIESAFGQIHRGVGLLDLRSVADKQGFEWLRQPIAMRTIGAVAGQAEFRLYDLTRAFDALVYFDRTTAARTTNRR